MTTVTDRTLFERWIALRDAEAFNEIISRHAGMVFGVCKRLVRNDADAEDVAQDCFLKLARTGSVPRSSVLGWLHAVATRCAVDFLRARSRRELRERASAMARAAERSAESTLEEVEAQVDECLAQLPAELRDVIVAHFLERRAQEDVAAALGVSRQTVSHRIQKGIERLRLLLARRGVGISGAALAASLGSSLVEAAPGALLASLGRIALAGPSISAGPAVSPSLVANVGGFLVAKKLLISVLVAAALLLLSGIAAFKSLLDPAPRLASNAGDSPVAIQEAPAADAGDAIAHPAAGRRTESVEAEVAGAAPRTQLAGRVVDAEGRPVSGASVVAAAGQAGRRAKVLEAISDEAGAFRLELAGQVEVAVHAFRRGVGLGSATGEPSHLEIVLAPLSTVGGKFYDRDTGEGIAGLKVQLSRYSSPGVSPEFALLHSESWELFRGSLHGESGTEVTDEHGHYLFQEVSPLRYRFELDPDASEYVLPGYRLHDSVPEVQLDPGESRSGVDFALQRGGSISGTVSGPDGQALPGAQVELITSYSDPGTRELRCDAEGSYRFLGLAPNTNYVVEARHAGYPPGESPTVAMPAAEAVEGVDVRLSHGHTVRGRFLDDLGAPLAGMEVVLFRRSESSRGILGSGLTVTAADGSFLFDSVAPGAHILGPSSEMHVADGDLGFTMPPGEDLPGLELVLRRKAAGYISGRVVTSSGEPIAGIPVGAKLGLKTVSQARTREDGAFRLDALGDASAYTVAAYSSDYWSAFAQDVPPNSTGVTLVVLRRGRIHGRVVDVESGVPVQHFEVRAVFIRTLASGGENRFHLKWTPFDSETGEFLIEGAEPVDSEIQVRAEGHAGAKSARFAVPPGGIADGIVIPLSRGVLLGGIVRDAETGDPIPGVNVRAHQLDVFQPWLLQESKAWYAESGIWKLEMSRADGSFAFSGLKPDDTIHVVAWKKGYGTVVRQGLAARPEAGGLNISMAREGKILITARFFPRPNERYELHACHREEKPWRHAFHAAVKAERPGPFEISGLPPGSHRLAVYSVKERGGRANHRLLGDLRLQVSPGETREILVDIDELAKRFASISGRVTGRADQGQVLLNLVSTEEPEERYTYGAAPPDPDGRFQFTGLPSGKYLIIARNGPTGEARVPVQVGEGEQREVEVGLE